MDTHRCVLNDDSQEIVSEIKESDVLVFATPVYYYEMSGQMKTLFRPLQSVIQLRLQV